ncbi:MAG TPA: hypothetical protein VN808_09645 [Stellaceae bacterium]|nr:hypothetical protein [Stellaceae bacterium]
MTDKQKLMLWIVARDRECPDRVAAATAMDAIKDARHYYSDMQSGVEAATIMFGPIGWRFAPH